MDSNLYYVAWKIGDIRAYPVRHDKVLEVMNCPENDSHYRSIHVIKFFCYYY